MPSTKRINRAFSRIHAEGQGVWQLSLIGPEIVPQMMAAAMDGSEQDQRLLGSIMTVVDTFKKNDALCLFCPASFAQAPPVMLIAMHAGRDDLAEAVWNGLCAACRNRFGTGATAPAVNREYEAIAQEALKFYRERLGAKHFRVLPKASPPGRA